MEAAARQSADHWDFYFPHLSLNGRENWAGQQFTAGPSFVRSVLSVSECVCAFVCVCECRLPEGPCRTMTFRSTTRELE